VSILHTILAAGSGNTLTAAHVPYPEVAIKEGIASVLSVPIIIGENLVGCMRVYTAEPWEFSLNDVNFIQAVAQLVGMALELCRINKGLKDSIDILKLMEGPKVLSYKRRTPYESVPKSFPKEEIASIWRGIL
jgi:GAF domain-containing protein